MDKLIEELDEMCRLLSYKNIDELHESTLEFFIDEAKWAICNLQTEKEFGDKGYSRFYSEKVRVYHIAMKKLCKRYSLNYLKEN